MEKAVQFFASTATSLKKLLRAPQKEKDKAKAKRLDRVKVTKEVLVNVKVEVTAHADIAYDLYGKLLTGDTEGQWDQIVQDMHTKNPWMDLTGVKHNGLHTMTQESLKDSIEFHKLIVFTVDAAEKLKYYLMCYYVKKPVRYMSYPYC